LYKLVSTEYNEKTFFVLKIKFTYETNSPSPMGGKILFLAPLARKRFGSTAGISPKNSNKQLH
jgi:hypothetical protein